MPLLSDLQNTPDPRLGLAFPGSDTTVYPAMSEAGIGTCRQAAAWTSSIAGIKARTDALRALGIRPFLTFECNDETKTRPDTHGITNQIPLDMNEWLGFVTEVVNLGPADYQILNEWASPNSAAGSWKGTDEELVDFAAQSAAAVRAANPSAKVWMGGLASTALDVLVVNRQLADWEVCMGDSQWTVVCKSPQFYRTPEYDALVDRTVAIMGEIAPYVDGLDLHLYGPVDRNPIRIDAIRNLGWTKPLMTAEAGGPSLVYGPYSEEKHFLSMMEGTLSALSEGLEFSGWYRLGEGESSYANSKTALYDENPKPGLWALKLLGKALEGVTQVSRQGTEYTLFHPGGRRVAAWGSGYAWIPEGKMWRVNDYSTGSYHIWDIPTARWFPLGMPFVAGM